MHVLSDRTAVLARLDDPELPHHMDAAVTWMRHNGPTKSRRAPVMIRAGEQPVSLSA